MRRVLVVGSSGAGKSTFARALAERMGVPVLELDSVFHQPGWTELELGEFRRRVASFVAADAWVVDGNYARVRDLVLAWADAVVWLRLPRGVVMRQVLRRTTSRVVHRQELWNGNRESLRNVLSPRPERSIVAWAWQMHGKYDEEYQALKAAAPAGQRWVVLRSRRDVDAFLSD